MPDLQPITTQSKQASSKKKFILVAEDDNFYANIYKVKLAKEGYDVQVVGNGEWVLKMIQQKVPDLILLDLVMPVMDGFETLKALKSNPATQATKVIVLSSLGQDEDIEKAKQLGASDYLIKTNVSIQEVIEKIKSYVK